MTVARPVLDNPHQESEARAPSWPWWRWALTGLSALALVLSAYLGWHHLSGESTVGCEGGSSCDQILKSRWSTIAGLLPVSGLATGAYLAMLVAGFFIGTGTEAPIRRLAWRCLLVLAGAAAGSAVWFTIVQKWILGAFCPYCMATHIIGLLLAALVIWRAPRHLANGRTDVYLNGTSSSAAGGRLLARLAPIAPTLIGVGLAGVLAACQLGFAPPAFNRVGESQRKPPAMDPHQVPLVGSPEAPYVVNLLFDYKCPHCQQLHFMLNEATRRYGGKLAFALCPTPLNHQCNPFVPRNVEEFTDSCELAKVGLAVWVVNREAFRVFDDWMFSFESGDRWHPRSLDAARAKAVELVGRPNFDTAWADPWINQHMQNSIRIFADTLQSGNGAIPKLVFGSRWVIPEPRDAHDLILILQKSLAVPGP